MSVTVQQGLSDLSRELGEGTVNSGAQRVAFYADAVQTLFTQRKWSFATKTVDLAGNTQSGVTAYSASAITDMRDPGGIKEITIDLANGGKPILPIAYEDRNDPRYTNKNYFWFDEIARTINFMFEPEAGKVITVRYYHIPARVTDADAGSYSAVPTYARKALALLAASYVQYSRYLDSQGDKKYQLYTLQLQDLGVMDRERISNAPRKFGNFLQFRGFRRTYP